MYYNDQRCDEPKEIVELFANYFEDIYERDDEDTVFEEIYKNEPVNSKEVYLTMFDIENAIIQLESKDNCGPDKLSPIVIKNCMDALVWPLWILYQKTYDLESIPSKLKKVKGSSSVQKRR